MFIRDNAFLVVLQFSVVYVFPQDPKGKKIMIKERTIQYFISQSLNLREPVLSSESSKFRAVSVALFYLLAPPVCVCGSWSCLSQKYERTFWISEQEKPWIRPSSVRENLIETLCVLRKKKADAQQCVRVIRKRQCVLRDGLRCTDLDTHCVCCEKMISETQCVLDRRDLETHCGYYEGESDT